MKIIIKFNKKFANVKDKEMLKKTIDMSNLKEEIKTAIDNGYMGLNLINVFGDWVYKIRIKGNRKWKKH